MGPGSCRPILVNSAPPTKSTPKQAAFLAIRGRGGRDAHRPEGLLVVTRSGRAHHENSRRVCIPVGFACEDWRTGRYIMRMDAGHRWPFEDNSFDAVYSEHMFEHILPMDGSSFIKEMYRILKPGGGAKSS